MKGRWRVSDRLVQLIDAALDNRPTRFDEDPWRVIKRAGLSESDMPVWYRGESHAAGWRPLEDEPRKKAAPVIVWLRQWVRPVLQTLQEDRATVQSVLAALPAPHPVPADRRDGKSIRLDHEARKAFTPVFDVPSVHLWTLWRKWGSLTGDGTLRPAPAYPGVDRLGQDVGRFKQALLGPFSLPMFSEDAPRAAEKTCDALRWLRGALAGAGGAASDAGQGGGIAFPWGRASLAFALLIGLELFAVIAAWLWGQGDNLLQKIGNCWWLLASVLPVVALVSRRILGRTGWSQVKKMWHSWRGEA